MIEEILSYTSKYKAANKKQSRKLKGQFFTSPRTALYMAQTVAYKADHLSILDPGCGNLILAASTIEYSIMHNLCFNFTITAVENDPVIGRDLSFLCNIISNYVQRNGGTVVFNIIHDNFITHHFDSNFDIVICNPPYKKLRKDSIEAESMSDIVYGQPNLYGLFMAKGLSLLRNHGRFSYITPRSWASGQYYSLLRKFLFQTIDIEDIVLFEKRDNVFKGEQVLQETMITAGTKKVSNNCNIKIHTVAGDFCDYIDSIAVSSESILDSGEWHCLLLPTSESDLRILSRMNSIRSNLKSLGYSFKTGPVVEFRNASYLSVEPFDNSVPMIRASNIVDGHYVFPSSVEKAQYVSAAATHLLIKNAPTVFVKRITAKEEKRRIQSCVYSPSDTTPYISVENHVNYLARLDGKPLSLDEVEYVNQVLSSSAYDSYYRIIGGSTQVNSNELNYLPFSM